MTSSRCCCSLLVVVWVIGCLPPSISRLTSLERLWAFSNRLSGPLTEPFSRLTRLRDVQVRG